MKYHVSAWLPLALGSVLAVGGAAPSESTTASAEVGVHLEEFPFCAAPTAAHGMRPRIQLAATRTEVPPGEMKAATPAPDFADTEPPLWDGLGAITLPITTSSTDAQAYFDQGLRLAYGFNHGEAQRSFRKAQKLDPTCGMCFWGEALVLGPNINLPMQEDALVPAYAAAQRAQQLATTASSREQALIGALAKRYSAERYSADPRADRARLDVAYAESMREVATRFPEDNDIAVLYAESVMDLSPWDYWQKGGREPNLQSAPILPTLETVLARAPGHFGAIHLYIHAVEASDRPERAEAHADRMRGAVPGAGHLVHMPSHIYYRVGRYLDALADNKTAVAVDEKYLADANAPMGVYRLGYYPHNIHFVMASAQMSGDGPTVIAAAEKLRALIPDEVAKGIAMVHPVKAAPYFAHAQFSSTQTILELPDPGNEIPYVKAVWHYMRGVALAAADRVRDAEAEAAAIDQVERTADFSLLKASGIPAYEVLKLASAVVRARVAQQVGNFDGAIAEFEKAAALQDGLAYTEPPYWYYPVRQSLGAALLQAGRLAEAAVQFEDALNRAPANGWSYYGLSEVSRAKGDSAGAQQVEAKLARTWIGDRNLLQLNRL
jgi:tetratricopeptide (TPR) repeat protein